jgi:signal transduction histidine kinase
VNLSRFDTLLTRLVLVAAISVAASMALVFFVLQVQREASRANPPEPFQRIETALKTLDGRAWPQTVSDAELKALHLKAYSVTSTPQFEVPGLRLEMLLEHEPGRLQPEGGQPGLWPRPPGEGGEHRFGNGPPRDWELAFSIELEDGRWANLTFQRLQPPGSVMRFVAPLLIFVLMVLIAAWTARSAIRPLRKMAASADILASDLSFSPIDERGPSDVRLTLQRFNRMGQRLEKTVESQRQLLAAIGHDLRTPITSLRLKIEMLSDPAEQERLLRAVTELERITEAALMAAAAGRSTGKPERLDIVSLVESLHEDLTELGLPVDFRVPDETPIVRGNGDELIRALRNILENAVRYGHRARTLLEAGPQSVRIHVEDDGPGIPESDMASVFEPLVRLEQSRNRDTGGHGLGLHIARSIIEAHGGSIRLANRPGGGLIVIVTLPRED